MVGLFLLDYTFKTRIYHKIVGIKLQIDQVEQMPGSEMNDTHSEHSIV